MGRNISINVSEYNNTPVDVNISSYRDTPIDIGLRLGKGYVPYGGNEGQVLTRTSDGKYAWQNVNLSGDFILSKTTAEWNSTPQKMSEKNVLYIYTDHEVEEDAQGNITYIPGIKIGDGTTYLIDLPFTDLLLTNHLADTNIHVTPAEKEFWNNKVRALVNAQDEENLILTIY